MYSKLRPNFDGLRIRNNIFFDNIGSPSRGGDGRECCFTTTVLCFIVFANQAQRGRELDRVLEHVTTRASVFQILCEIDYFLTEMPNRQALA